MASAHRASRLRSYRSRSTLGSRVDVDFCRFEEPPSPRTGEKRCLFVLDPLEHHVESKDRMLELIPGRMELVDGINTYYINGCTTEERIPDLDYVCYRVSLGDTNRSRYAVPPDVAPEEKFVSHRNRKLIPYNSRKPVVVYMPENADLHYRIWTGGEEIVAKKAESMAEADP